MTIRAIVFDIGGVLEITPNLGVDENWEQKLNLRPGKIHQLLRDVWHGGSIGTISIEQVHRSVGEIMNWNEAQVNEFMADYFRSLRPKYQTAIISNSFVGAREKEAEHYQVDTICDFIIYSHEVGLRKPDPKIFQMACEQLSLQPYEIILVDDRKDRYASAEDMGIHCIEFKDNAQVIADIEACIQANGG